MPAVRGRSSVWQVHHFIIKGQIITRSTICMTITLLSNVPRKEYCRFLLVGPANITPAHSVC